MGKKTTGNPIGRPTDYTPELLIAAHAYADGAWELAGDAVPSIAGLACEIGVRRETCHAWAKDPEKDEFSNILGKIAETQERKLINGGILGEFNPPITKMMLSKHGYSDSVRQDNTSSDGTMSPVGAIERVIVKPDGS
mgnify:CR=1 FL=1